MERITAQCHLHAVPRFIQTTYENFAVAATTALITLNTNYCVVVPKCLAVSTTLILANSTELNQTETSLSVCVCVCVCVSVFVAF